MNIKRILCLSAGMVLLLPLVALAEDAPVSDLHLGYSYLRLNAEKTFTAAPQQLYPPTGLNMNGWDISGSWNLNRSFGLVADISSQYRRTRLQDFGLSQNRTYTYLFGPQFTYRGHDCFQPFVHTLFGVTNGRFDPNGPFVARDAWFGMAIGGGCDWKLSNRVALRLGQADYMLTRYGKDATHNNFRFAAGVVFRILGRG